MTSQPAAVETRAIIRKADLVKSVCDYIKDNSASKITLRSLGERFCTSPFRLQRTFTEVMGISPRRYLEECRLGDLRSRLTKGEPVLNALRGSGYSSQSWLYADSRTKLGMTPASYRQGGQGAFIEFATGSSPLGRLLLAATKHGVCSVKAGNTDEELERALRREFPRAKTRRSKRAKHLLGSLNDHLAGQEARFPLDIAGTDFQLRVWSALRGIPLGETRSYSEVAASVGDPRAVRAVANACAANPVPLIIPCHRVIRKNGDLGGYGLGVKRKRALLATERRLSASDRR